MNAAGGHVEVVRVAPPCMWFLQCTNDAIGTVWHPVLGHVACCARCATVCELRAELQPFADLTGGE